MVELLGAVLLLDMDWAPTSSGYGHGCSEGYGDSISEGSGSGKSIGFGLEWKNLFPSGCGYGTSTGAGGFNGHNGLGYCDD